MDKPRPIPFSPSPSSRTPANSPTRLASNRTVATQTTSDDTPPAPQVAHASAGALYNSPVSPTTDIPIQQRVPSLETTPTAHLSVEPLTGKRSREQDTTDRPTAKRSASAASPQPTAATQPSSTDYSDDTQPAVSHRSFLNPHISPHLIMTIHGQTRCHPIHSRIQATSRLPLQSARLFYRNLHRPIYRVMIP
ncbi:MAG TPA: hypothetical protein PLV25_05190 [Opitutales bacterium]|nr:hypothetical protein [Opitutales bacterium]